MAHYLVRTLQRVGERLILALAKKTGRLIISVVACKSGGCGAGLPAGLSGPEWASSKAPIGRVNFI